MKRAYIIAALFTGLIGVGNSLVMMSGLPDGFKIYITQLVIVILFHIAAVIILLMALKGFSRRLKVTYLLLSLSFLMLVLGLLQGVVVDSFKLTGSAFVDLGGDDIVFLAHAALAYYSLRILAMQADISSKLLNPWLTFGLAIAVGAITVVLPSPRIDIPQHITDIAAFNTAAGAVLLSVVATLAFKTAMQISPLYKSALRWVGFYFISGGLVTGCSAVAQVYLPYTHWFWQYGVMYTIYNFTAVAAVIMALKFSRVAYAEDQIIKQINSSKSTQPTNSVDIVTTVAQLVSNTRGIDHALDEVRLLTASFTEASGAHALSEEQQLVTARAYLEIENFLVNHEPIRKFNREQLRQMLDIRYREAVQEPAFWRTLAT